MTETSSAREKGLHNHFIKKKLHHRIRHLTPANINDIGRARTPGGLAEDAMPDWFAALTGVQQQIVRNSQKRSRASNDALAKTLKGLKGLTEFAQPLLEAALQKKYGLTVDVANTLFYKMYNATDSVEEQTLLQAALRNFEDGQSFADEVIVGERGASVSNVRVQGQLYGWTDPPRGRVELYKIKKLPIKPVEFAALCRDLDIGKQYQDHLKARFEAADRASTVRTQTLEAWKDSLRVHAHIARLKSLITPSGYLAMLGVLNGEKAPKLDGETVTFSQLHVLGAPASEMFVIGASRRKEKKVDLSWTNPGVNLIDVLTYTDSRIIVCIPGDPVAPVKEYDSLKAFEKDLALRLRGVSYQQSFLRLIPHGDAGKFLGKVQSALQTLKWNPDFPHRDRTLLGHRDGIYERVYRDDPDLDISETFFDGELFGELYSRHLTRLKESAEQLAVPTAKVDHDAWYERLKHYAEWGLNILNVAAFFVPGLGEVMMAVMAVQLTADVYHGVEAWSIGDMDQAWNYLGSVAANVAFMAVLGAVASKAPKVLSTPVVDGLVKVKLPFGDEQLWRPGLTPYKSDVVLSDGLKPNTLGQYEVNGKTYIRLDGDVYEKTFDPSLNKWRLKHPTDPNAYHPILEHNGQGAWRHSFERPLEWDRATLLRRLGHMTDGIDAATLEKIADTSGVDDAALRKVHVDNQPIPSLLSDTLRQFQIDRQVNEMIEQVRLGEPVPDNRYDYALPEVVSLPRWLKGRVIEVYDASLTGTPSRYGQASIPSKPAIRVSLRDVSAGRLSERVLATLDEQEIIRLLGEEGARVEAEREAVFCQQLAEHLSGNKTSVFDSASKGFDTSVTQTPELKELRRTFPSLSIEAAQEVLGKASIKERLSIKQKGRPPASLLLKARARARLSRLNKALSGMQLESMASLDSQRLALRALEKLPGWPERLRLEIRQRDYSGKLLDSIGSESAEDVKYLVTDGYQHHRAHQFQAFDGQGNALNSVPGSGDNFYASIMHALPDEARIQLGLPNVGQSAELQKALTTYAMGHREPMLQALVPNAATRRFKSAVRLADGRLGYPLSGRGAGEKLNPSLVSRVRDVYPGLPDALAEMMVNQLLLDGRTESQVSHLLNERAREYEALTAELDQWVSRDGAISVRPHVVQMIKNTWGLRGIYDTEATVHLDWSGAESLPELTARFPHVRNVKLSVEGMLSQAPEAFVRQFPNARSLELEIWDATHRAQLIERLKTLSTLRELRLTGSLGQEFSESAQALMDVMPQLERLELRGVESELDVSRLADLRSLTISGILATWPKGALQLQHLKEMNLSHTYIKTLPSGLFSGHEDLWRGLNLNWARRDREQFVKVYEYVHDNPAHLLDTEHMLDRYCQDTLQNVMDSGSELSAAALRQLKAEGLSGRALLDHVNGVRQDRQALFEPLYAWQERSPMVGGRPVDRRGRETAARFIRECWREGLRARYSGAQDVPVPQPQPGPSARPTPAIETADSATLDLSGAPLGDLPELPALSTTGFTHVQTLKMPDVTVSVDDFSQFLRNFTEVRTLDLSRNQLFDLPSTLGSLGQLKDLSLQHNYLTITPSIQRRLNGLSRLQNLDLRYNRVESLDVTSMHGLRALRLGHTAIEEWPEGVLDLPGFWKLELNNSAVTAIPKAALKGHDNLLVDMSGCRLTLQSRHDLLTSSNSFSPMGISRADLRDGITIGGPAYFPPLVSQHPELLLSLSAVSADELARMTPQARLQRLDPELGASEAVQAVDELTLQAGGAIALFDQLTRWDEQYQALTRTLNDWIAAPPFKLRELDMPLWVSAMERSNAAGRIMTCWRQSLRGAAAVEGGSGGYTLDLSDTPLGSLPALSGDFAHVGTLKLNKIFINEAGLEDFLVPFGGLHTLELDHNSLSALPEGVTSLGSLRRLSAAHNRFTASSRFQRQLAALRSLESLDLANNWLEMLDITSLTELQTLDLHDNRLVSWPLGVLDLPSLRTLDLRDNMLESIPPELMTEEHRPLRASTNLAGNDNLDGAVLLMLRNHVEDGAAIMGWSVTDIEEALDEYDADDFDDLSTSSDEEVDVSQVTGAAARERWIDPSTAGAEELKRIWDGFEEIPGSGAFFNLLDRMEGTKDFTLGRADLTRRVHRVLKAADSDDALRETIFSMAQSPLTCGDGRILLFSDIEVKVFEFETVKSTPLNQQDSVLYKLGRNLFRLGKIEKIANRDILKRQEQGGRPDPAEVRLAYRIGLSDRLELPGQPKDMLYSGNVSPLMLDAAYAEVIQAEQATDFMDELVGRKYWADHLKRKYPERFIALKESQVVLQSELEDRYPDINEAYLTELGTLEVTFKTQETQLLLELSGDERKQFSL
ncbi:NEL-type E3 ubiquitin ligase domain-containing protein [Pseudomonas sp. LT1P18]|uniref:NEL-type E3 ubiquitin ligase domain-containing protein n=1 Tax=Pseudomonas arabinosi TaxID=3398357 RepID=UPI0039F094F3